MVFYNFFVVWYFDLSVLMIIIGQFDVLPSVMTSIGCFQGFLVAANLFFLKKGSRKANLFLMGLLIAQSLIIFQNFVVFSGLYPQMPHVPILFYSLNGLIGPLFFFYVLYLLYPHRNFRWIDSLHGSIFIYLLFFSWNWEYITMNAEEKIKTISYIYNKKPYIPDIDTIFTLLSLAIVRLSYVSYALWLLNKKKQGLKKISSDTNISYLNRFKGVIYIFGAYSGISFLFFLVSYFFHIKVYYLEIYLHLINSIFLVVIAIITIQQPEKLFFVLKKEKIKEKQTKGKNLELDKLSELMKTQQPYLNPELKLQDLAAMMDTPSHNLSEQLNKNLGVNFYDFINQYRVDEFKKRATSSEYDQLTLLAIALDSGFNSKASFNRIFKKYTKITPSQFLHKRKVSTSKIGAKFN
ncbi:AraC family transcriptional regulator [Aquimarina sp. RZ0]|uniref:helix-turn-helix domain-containing protein n=1 Tax=Aquimarina sp. RZ0 TaxID=2607730 RepID=UPI0011F1981C|nr:helix-turn-helix domain-containing protein [Aquimarina sp. RZ0]KAA1245261.1 AraC family transcriptional regulator [Aquimarina sp. RZ0]